MPGANLLALLDDVTTVLDDVAVLTKVATKKTAGVLGDDLALNAEQVAGVRADRELPVVWAVAKGSLVNKAILVPAAIAISAFIPWGITPLLVAGGTFLCFEGCEKLHHKFFHTKEEAKKEHAELIEAVTNDAVDLVEFERQKIKGAIRTDFILSAEIVVIALGTVAAAPLATRVSVLVALALLMTVGVYGLVAGIVKLDDLGQSMAERSRKPGATLAGLKSVLASAILVSAPWLMKALSVAGTVAMFLVGGGIIAHAIPALHDFVHHQADSLRRIPGAGPLLSALLPTLADLLAGLATGAVALAAWSGIQRVRSGRASASRG